MGKLIVTIARQYGSGGKTIGQMLAENLGVNCYNREILRMASDDSGIKEELFNQADEKLRNNPLFGNSTRIYKGGLIQPDHGGFVSADNLFNYQAKVIKELAEKESCVFIGRCADFVLKDRPDVMSVFIHAPQDYCLARGMERNSMTEKEMERSERICLGAVVGVHGIKGEVKVKSFTEVDRDLDKYGPVENKAGDKVFSVKVTGHSKELLRVKIKGVDDRSLAETLVGTEFYVSKSALPEPEEDEYYHADLIGLTVREKNSGKEAGTVAGVYNFGAGDILELKLKKSGRLEMIPFTKQYVPVVNVKEGFIIVESAIMNFAQDDAEEEVSDEG